MQLTNQHDPYMQRLFVRSTDRRKGAAARSAKLVRRTAEIVHSLGTLSGGVLHSLQRERKHHHARHQQRP